MKKTVLLFAAVSLLAYSAVPLLNAVVPESMTYTFLLDLCVTNSLYALLSALYLGGKCGFKLWIPLLGAGLFVPILFLFYNTSALIYLVFYLVLAIVGCTVGALLRRTRQRRS